MPDAPRPRTGGQILVDQLRLHGADTVFGVPGESYLAVLDALHDAPDVRFVICRQEGGAAMMADADGKLTGRPGICMVTRGPGATNASAGVHIAFQDSTPMILLIGQVGRDMAEREAFQEIDYRRMFGQMAKWVAQIDDAARIPEFMARAFHTAVQGRPGPVVLALPEDMLRETATIADPRPYAPAVAHPGRDDMAALDRLLRGAKQPFAVLGGGGWSAAACDDFRAFAEAASLPVGTAFRCQDYIDNEYPLYAGDVGIGINPKLAGRIDEADLLLVVGARLGEATTGGYSLIEAPRPRQTLIHIHPGAEELGRVYQPDLAIQAGIGAFAAAARALAPIAGPPWAEWAAAAHADYLDYNRPIACPGPVQMAEIVATIREMLPADAIITNGAGNYAAWVHRFFRLRHYRGQLGPTSGSMGYGTPAAVAARLRHPDRPVVAFAGDGCFLMHGQELATAMQYRANITIIVVNNGMFGTIRMHQERDYPERVVGTTLTNPDFAALARAYGGTGAVVERTGQFAEAFATALAHDGPSLIELRLDPEALTPRASLSQIREAGQRR
ncbi:MAG: thiamine pyrophosphate-binding protein [Inquilinus sp.]|nr:thiamine pyrophosphate-binding protein [Inquilinus sp.]